MFRGQARCSPATVNTILPSIRMDMLRTLFAVFCGLTSLSASSAGRLISLDAPRLPTVNDGPPFCHGHECPPFAILKTTSRYQLRQYEEGKPA